MLRGGNKSRKVVSCGYRDHNMHQTIPSQLYIWSSTCRFQSWHTEYNICGLCQVHGPTHQVNELIGCQKTLEWEQRLAFWWKRTRQMFLKIISTRGSNALYFHLQRWSKFLIAKFDRWSLDPALKHFLISWSTELHWLECWSESDHTQWLRPQHFV